MAVLGDDQLAGGGVVDKDDHVGVGLLVAGLAQVGQGGAPVGALLDGAGDLGGGDDGDAELLGQILQRAGDLADLAVAGVVAAAGVGELDALDDILSRRSIGERKVLPKLLSLCLELL